MGRVLLGLNMNELIRLNRLSHSSNPRTAERAMMVKDLSMGMMAKNVALKYRRNYKTVLALRGRIIRHRVQGLWDVPRSGRKDNGLSVEDLQFIILRKEPPDGVEKWSVRLLAEELGVSPSKIYRILSRNNIPLSREDLQMKMRIQEKLCVSSIKGIFISPILQAIVFQMENPGIRCPNANHMISVRKAPCTDTEMYNSRAIELIDTIAGIISELPDREKKKRDILDFLLFLKNIDGLLHEDTEGLLIMSSLAVDIGDGMVCWLRQHPRFHVISSSTDEMWLDLMRRQILCIGEDYRRLVFFHMEHLLADIAILGAKSDGHPGPFISYIAPR